MSSPWQVIMGSKLKRQLKGKLFALDTAGCLAMPVNQDDHAFRYLKFTK